MLRLSSAKSDFTQGNILGKMIRFMMPILGALILQAAYGAVDLLVVGRIWNDRRTFGSIHRQPGSESGNICSDTVRDGYYCFLIARYIGEKDTKQIGPLIGGATVVFAIISAVLFVVMITLAHPISVLMQAPEEAVEKTAVYVRICGAVSSLSWHIMCLRRSSVDLETASHR